MIIQVLLPIQLPLLATINISAMPRDGGEVCKTATFDTLTDGRTVEACGSANKNTFSETMPLAHVSNVADNLSFIANSSLEKGFDQ